MQTIKTDTYQNCWQKLSAVLGLYALLAGAFSFAAWPFDIPRLADWFNGGVSVQPNTAVLIAVAGAAVLLLQSGYRRITLALGGLVAVAGAINLLQYIVGADFGFNDLLIFDRSWGHTATVSPGRFGPPASISFILIGTSLLILSIREPAPRRFVPGMALLVVLLMTFSLLGYLFGALNFYAIPWLSAIALPTSTMLLALAVSLVVSVPEHHPMLLLSERSSAGAMARTVLPILAVMIPSVIWLRIVGYENQLFDLGTSHALGAAVLELGVIALMWIALLALRRRDLQEREADRRKDEFIAMLAHELRNPLAPIRNAVSVLKLARGDRETSELAAETISRQSGQLVRLIDDLLDASRINQGKLELRPERVELAPIIHQAVETCRPMADAAGQEVTVSLPPHPIYLNADPIRLSQVVSNLLSNACKFVDQPGLIDLIVEQHGNDARIIVKDNGIGIPPDKLDGIFEMFSQVDQSLERSQGGLGIGLTLARRLVELHGGSIEARSEGYGKGSEFVVRLPVAPGQTSPQPETTEDEITPGAKRRILVVDDNRDNAESLAILLRFSGNEVTIAYDGEQAVEAAARQAPDVILLDIGLPKLNGYDACRRIREYQWAKDVIIIALTGWGQEEDRRKSAQAGFDGHLVKPVDYAELMRLLARQPRQEERYSGREPRTAVTK